MLRPACGRLVPYFRFPGLCADGQVDRPYATGAGDIVSGDVLSGDRSGASATTIANRVLGKVKPGLIVIVIVIMNTSKVGAPNPESALRPIVEGLRREGAAGRRERVVGGQLT